MRTIYDWQKKQWNYLTARIASTTFPHALLLDGPAYLGKSEFALALAELLLCENPSQQRMEAKGDSINGSSEHFASSLGGKLRASGTYNDVLEHCEKRSQQRMEAKSDGACGKCKSCKLIAAESHPDFYLLRPTDNSKIIKIEQIREVIAATNKKSHQNSYQVVIINPADSMHIAASNALLKTLEEPSGDVIFILITNRPSALPATIRSRCQHVKFYSPNKETIATWLQQKINTIGEHDFLLTLAPLEALNLASDENRQQRHNLFEQLTFLLKHQLDPLSFANSIANIDLKLLLKYLHSWFMDLLRLKFDLTKEFITNNDYLKSLHDLDQEIGTKKLLNCLDKIIALYKHMDNNLNQQLMLEDLSIVIGQ